MSSATIRLDERMRSVRGYLKLRTWTTFALWLGTASALLLALVWLTVGSDGWRPGSDLPLVLDAGLATVSAAGAMILALAMRRRFADARLSAVVEEAAALRAGELRGTLELRSGVGPGCSEALAACSARRLTTRLDRLTEAELSGDLGAAIARWLRRSAICASGCATVLAALAASSPERSASVWLPLSRPLAGLSALGLPPLAVHPGSVEVARGSPLTVTVSAPGRAGAVTLRWQEEGDVARSARLVPDDDGRSSYEFREIGAPLRYRARTEDGAESALYLVTPVDPLFVGEVTISVRYPHYTGIAPEEAAGDVGALVIPVGTRLLFSGVGSKPFGRAALTDSIGGRVHEMAVDGERFDGLWTPATGGTYRWSATDAAGAEAELVPPPLTLALIPDGEPEVRISYPGRDTLIGTDLRQPLVLEAADDYGLDRIELAAYRISAFGERYEPVTARFDVGGARLAQARPTLDLRGWSLMPNDTVRYRARVVDRSPMSQVGESQEYLLVMPASAELRRLASEAIERAGDQISEIATQVDSEARQNRDEARQAESDERGVGFLDRERVREALDDQESIRAELDSLAADLSRLKDLLSETAGTNPELDRELQALQELLEDMAGTDELQERMEALARELDQEESSGASRELESLAEDQESLRDRLLESLERFRRAAVEQNFRATTDEARELARLQRAVADAMREGDRLQDRARQQEALARRSEELAAEMEALREDLAELDEEKASDRVDEARKFLDRARRNMEAAEEAADQGEGRGAAREADEAGDALEELVRELGEAQAQMADMAAAEVAEALERTADDALALSRRQASLRSALIGSDPDEIADMRGDQAAILEGMDNLAENLQAASEGAIMPGTGLWEQMGRSVEALGRTLSTMEVRRGGASQPQVAAERAVRELNQLALVAQLASVQMGEGGGEPQEMSERLEELARQQGELINEAAELVPLQLGDEAMAQQMQQIAAGQETVSDELGELADDPSASEALGDLEELAEEAAALAEQLAGLERLTPEVARRQERLFHRLLDAGRSLEREEYSEERESEAPGEFERRQTVPLEPDQLGILRYGSPEPQELHVLSPAVRALVLEYFERLNRGVTPGGEG